MSPKPPNLFSKFRSLQMMRTDGGRKQKPKQTHVVLWQKKGCGGNCSRLVKLVVGVLLSFRLGTRLWGISKAWYIHEEAGSSQSVGMGVRVCKSVCIEEKISGREVADYVASKEQNATPNSCDRQPPVHLFSPLYTRTYIHEPPFRHSGSSFTSPALVD